jgi:two-component system response regulator
VEDSSDDIALIKRIFEHIVVMNDLDVVLDGKGAMDYLYARGSYKDQDIKVQPMLVLLDTRLPKLGGLEVLQELRGKSETASLPVIMMNCDKEEIKVIDGYGLEVKAFLKKPFSFSGFVKAARDAGLRWMLFSEPLFPEERD